jgi:hypothetical protein
MRGNTNGSKLSDLGTRALCDTPRASNRGRILIGHQGSKEITAPGMSNVTYGIIKDWPDELITHCYQLLKNVWRKEHIPWVWKEEWAVLLAKSADTSDINNLRPIGLEDCMRKLWFSISYKRILQA